MSRIERISSLLRDLTLIADLIIDESKQYLLDKSSDLIYRVLNMAPLSDGSISIHDIVASEPQMSATSSTTIYSDVTGAAVTHQGNSQTTPVGVSLTDNGSSLTTGGLTGTISVQTTGVWLGGTGDWISVTPYTQPVYPADPVTVERHGQIDRSTPPARPVSIKFETKGIVIYEQDSFGAYHRRYSIPYEKLEHLTVVEGNQVLTPTEAAKLEREGDLREAQINLHETSEVARREKARADALANENEKLIKELAAMKRQQEEHAKFLDRFAIED